MQISTRLATLLATAATLAAQDLVPDATSTPLPTQTAPAASASPTWIVQCAGPGPDHSALRTAYATGAPTTTIAQLVEASEAAARQRQAKLVAAIEALGGRVLQRWWIVDAIEVSLPAGISAADLLRLPEVGHVEANRLVPGTTIRTAPLDKAIAAQGHNTVAAHAGGFTGAGRGGLNYQSIAVLDAQLLANMTTAPATNRHHGSLHLGGSPTATTRVVVDTAVGNAISSPVPFDHGNSIAAIAAGAQLSGPSTFTGTSNGHAPGAQIVSVNIATVTPAGAYPPPVTNPELLVPFSDTATLTACWQWVLANRANYGIRVAVNSFGGDPNPTAVIQQALDACADVGDVLVVVPSGNSGTSRVGPGVGTPNPCFDSQYAVNGVVVAAATSHSAVIPNWVTNAPLTPSNTVQPAGSTNLPTTVGYEREYPDLVAAGVDLVLPYHTTETGSVVNSGTSVAAPQVAGSGFLWLTGPDNSPTLPARTALMARAALLASSAQIPNTTAAGFLRSDWLTVDARTLGATADEVSMPLTSGRTYNRSIPVVAGRTYSVAIAWKRTDYSASPNWANLDLLVAMGGQTLGSSASTTGGGAGVRRTWERVVFTAPATGNVDVQVIAVSSPGTSPVVHAFAATELPVAGGPGTTRARFEAITTSPGANCQTPGLTPIAGAALNTDSIGPFPQSLKNYTGAYGRNLEAGIRAFQTPGGGNGAIIEFNFEVDAAAAGYVDVYSYSSGGGGYWNPCTTPSPTPQGGTIIDTCRVYHGPGMVNLNGRIQSGGYLVFNFPPSMRWWNYRTPISYSQSQASPWRINNCYSAWPYVSWIGQPVAGVAPTVGNAAFTFGSATSRVLNTTAIFGQPAYPYTHWEWRFSFRTVGSNFTTAPVALTAYGTPRIGNTFDMQARGSHPNLIGSGYLFFGLWNPNVPPVNFPIQPGSNCSWLVSPDLYVASLPTTSGYSTQIPVPNDPGFAGFGFEFQELVFDLQGGATTSNAVRAVLGF